MRCSPLKLFYNEWRVVERSFRAMLRLLHELIWSSFFVISCVDFLARHITIFHCFRATSNIPSLDHLWLYCNDHKAIEDFECDQCRHYSWRWCGRFLNAGFENAFYIHCNRHLVRHIALSCFQSGWILEFYLNQFVSEHRFYEWFLKIKPEHS